MAAGFEFDESGWAKGPILPLAPNEAWSLFAAEASSRVELARWAHQARTFFGATLEIGRPKKYPDDRTPIADAFELTVTRPPGGAPSRVLVVTMPLETAPACRDAAEAGVRAIGGAGFDALLARARRLWQVLAAVEPPGDERAALAAAAVLASSLLAPIVPPDEATIFGVKGARERLSARGWR